MHLNLQFSNALVKGDVMEPRSICLCARPKGLKFQIDRKGGEYLYSSPAGCGTVLQPPKGLRAFSILMMAFPPLLYCSFFAERIYNPINVGPATLADGANFRYCVDFSFFCPAGEGDGSR